MKKNLTIGASYLHAVKKALLIMKLTFLLLTLAMLQVSANVNGQAKVSLQSNQEEIARVLANIEKQSNYRFLYNNALKAMRQKISINVHDLEIKEALNTVFAGTDLTYKMLDNNLIVVLSTIAALQDIQITGRITGENGEPLSGVSIALVGSNRGTATDNNGQFTITVPQDGTLRISYVGYQNQEVKVNNNSLINIQLKASAIQMDQVVVVGYGSQRKSDVTGATATVKGSELAKQPVLTATQALQGKAAGVQIISNGQPGTSPQIFIRGTSTALGGTAVLYVVDGVLTDDISNINTADIVTMNILKDASATAIYGSRGANGVIIITTKRGVAGKPKISYDGNAGIRQAAFLVKMANAAEYANYASSASGLNIVAGTTSTDWYGQILRTAFEQNHNVSLSGGDEKATYFLSAGYFSDQGIVIDNVYKRFVIRSNSDFKISSKVRMGMDVSFSNGHDDRVDISAAYNDAYRAAPIIPSKINGKYGNVSSYQNVGNPLLDIESKKNPVINNRLEGAAYLEIKPIQSLTFRSSLGGDLQNINNTTYTYQFKNDTNTFITLGGNQQNVQSNLNVEYTKLFRYVWDNTITFNQRFDKHNLTVLVGTTAEQVTSTDFSASKKNVPGDPDLWYLSEGDANTSQIAADLSKIFKYTRNAYLGRINYSYNDRYLLTATIRADATSRFPPQNRWGYFPSVGLGWIITKESFMESQTIFDNLKLRGSWGKVGNDNIPADAFTVTTTPNLNYPFAGGTATPGSAITRIRDPNLKWENTTETDVAIEFSSLHNRLSGEVNYYNKLVDNALINVQIPGVAGDITGTVLTNAASIKNTGVEVSLNWADKLTNKISYHIGGNVTFNKNEVVGLNGGQPISDGDVSQSDVTRTDNGHPVGSFYVLKMIGVFQSDAEVANYKNPDGTQIQPGAHAGDLKYQKAPLPGGKSPTGAIDPIKDLQFVGSYQPVAYYGINLGIGYEHFDLSIDGYGNAGNQVYNGKKAFRRSDGGVDNIESYQAYARWTASNHSETEPAANKGLLPNSTYFLESGSFIRINNLTLGYTLASAILQKLRISSIRIYATSQNLFTYKKYSGFTPELPGSSPTNGGIELDAYPTTRTYAMGLNVGF
jgi:TonB-linked SusC/RagA family outer membrane protein